MMNRPPPVKLPRTVYRWIRKRLKRALSHGSVVRLRLRNLLSADSVVADTQVVVSLTTHGARVSDVMFAIESIGRGNIRPSRLVLWLDTQEEYDARPRSLRRLENRGLEIKLGGPFGPHNKYFPFVQSVQVHDMPLVTADDDILYPKSWLADLLEGSRRSPEVVLCYWASKFAVEDGEVVPYANWPRTKDTKPSIGNFATGVSGVLYPIQMLKELARRGEDFLNHCPKADDIWLHWVALQARVRIQQISNVPRHFRTVPGTQEQGLLQANVGQGRNDEYIKALYSKADLDLIESSSR